MAADPYVDLSGFDVVYLAPASQLPETVVFASLNSFGARADGREIRLWIPFDAGFASSEGDPRLVLSAAFLSGAVFIVLGIATLLPLALVVFAAAGV